MVMQHLRAASTAPRSACAERNRQARPTSRNFRLSGAPPETHGFACGNALWPGGTAPMLFARRQISRTSGSRDNIITGCCRSSTCPSDRQRSAPPSRPHRRGDPARSDPVRIDARRGRGLGIVGTHAAARFSPGDARRSPRRTGGAGGAKPEPPGSGADR